MHGILTEFKLKNLPVMQITNTEPNCRIISKLNCRTN